MCAISVLRSAEFELNLLDEQKRAQSANLRSVCTNFVQKMSLIFFPDLAPIMVDVRVSVRQPKCVSLTPNASGFVLLSLWAYCISRNLNDKRHNF